jgi:hypothetical protein
MVLLWSLEIADEAVKPLRHCCPEMHQQRSETPCVQPGNYLSDCALPTVSRFL